MKTEQLVAEQPDAAIVEAKIFRLIRLSIGPTHTEGKISRPIRAKADTDADADAEAEAKRRSKHQPIPQKLGKPQNDRMMTIYSD